MIEWSRLDEPMEEPEAPLAKSKGGFGPRPSGFGGPGFGRKEKAFGSRTGALCPKGPAPGDEDDGFEPPMRAPRESSFGSGFGGRKAAPNPSFGEGGRAALPSARAPRLEGGGRSSDDAAPRRKTPRKPSKTRIANYALHHAEECACTVQGLRDLLTRRVQRAAKFHPSAALDDAPAWIEDAIAACVAAGLLNDQRFAEGRASRLGRGGKARRSIRQRLIQKKVEASLIEETLDRIDADIAEPPAFGGGDLGEIDPDFARCAALVKKKRLGACRTTESRFDERKTFQRDLATLARSGFSYQTAKIALETDLETIEDLVRRLL